MRQKFIDISTEGRTRHRFRRHHQAVIGEQRFLAFLLLRLVDQITENAGVVVDVAIVDIVGQLLLMDQRLTVEVSPLPQQEGAQREQAAERGQRLFEIIVAERTIDAKIEAGDQKQDHQGRGELDQDRDAAKNGWYAQHELVGQAHHHPHIGKQRLEIGARDVPEILEQHRAAANFLTAPLAAPAQLAGVRRRVAARPGRNHHHHVVEHLDLVRAPAQAPPDRNFDGLHVAAAAEHADVTILLDRSLELDSNQSVFVKGLDDFIMRDLDEIGLGEHTHHLLAQPAIGRLVILLRSAGPRIDLGVERKIGFTQQVQLFEILVMKDGAELTRKLPEPDLTSMVEAARGREAVDQIRLPKRNETIPRLRHGRFARNSLHKTAVLAGIASLEYPAHRGENNSRIRDLPRLQMISSDQICQTAVATPTG